VIHHSYLLKFKGRYSTSTIQLLKQLLGHGTTLHYIDERLDEAHIDSWKCRIEEDDTAEKIFSAKLRFSLELKANFSRILLG
jgi:folate-dependent phosphoribosylglycinamide formyltransferase PurN